MDTTKYTTISIDKDVGRRLRESVLQESVRRKRRVSLHEYASALLAEALDRQTKKSK